MSTKQHRVARCRRKTARGNLYPTAEHAADAAARMNRKPGVSGRIRPFACVVCGWWHIGRALGADRRRR